MPTDARAESLALVQALFARAERQSDARAAFAKAFPAAPAAMCSTAAFHVYTDGVDAALAFLARAEQFLRTPTDSSAAIDYSVTYELLYHLYNWHQFLALLPDGKAGVLELLAELKTFVADDDRPAILQTVEELEDALEGHRSLPDFS